jgi:hypothetical protein
MAFAPKEPSGRIFPCAKRQKANLRSHLVSLTANIACNQHYRCKSRLCLRMDVESAWLAVPNVVLPMGEVNSCVSAHAQ